MSVTNANVDAFDMFATLSASDIRSLASQGITLTGGGSTRDAIYANFRVDDIGYEFNATNMTYEQIRAMQCFTKMAADRAREAAERAAQIAVDELANGMRDRFRIKLEALSAAL